MVKAEAFDEQKTTENILPINTAESQVGIGSFRLEAAELDLSVLVCPDYPLHPSVAQIADSVIDNHTGLKESGCHRRRQRRR